jgi:hypothetical protein
MKALILVCRDGARHLAQAWAQSRREAFALLRVVRVVEEYA